jgi:hypothetical protein
VRGIPGSCWVRCLGLLATVAPAAHVTADDADRGPAAAQSFWRFMSWLAHIGGIDRPGPPSAPGRCRDQAGVDFEQVIRGAVQRSAQSCQGGQFHLGWLTGQQDRARAGSHPSPPATTRKPGPPTPHTCPHRRLLPARWPGGNCSPRTTAPASKTPGMRPAVHFGLLPGRAPVPSALSRARPCL